MRFIIAVILGGIVAFAWGAVSHMVLGLEDNVVKPVPNEAAVMSALKTNINEPGFYFMRGLDKGHAASPEEMAAWGERYAAGPNAILIYHPTGQLAMSPRQFGIQIGTDFTLALVIAVILGFAAVGFIRGVIISTLVGVAGWIAILVPYWNWYRFPPDFVAAGLIDQVAGFFLVGLVMAFVLKPKAAAAAPPA